MRAWTRPEIPQLRSKGPVPRLFDSATMSVVEARPVDAATASLYVCGITPYDATHLGHAATYLAYDTLIRLWLDAGFAVQYAQNITDIDDPLLERATRDGVDWRDLAESQIELFRSDMQLLGIIPPDHYVGVTEVIDLVASGVDDLVTKGIAYEVASTDAAPDLYFDSALATANSPWHLGQESSIGRELMLEFSAERGGDPDRDGKHDPLDPLLWRSERAGEPAWDSPVGRGRPGWHIECSVIAQSFLPTPLTVNGGGSDLLFPHHEFSAGHTAALTGHALAAAYSHTGMVAYQGEKMSKSLGNLVFVSRLVADGVDPRVIRLALLGEHYRSDWEWTDAHLRTSSERLAAWQAWATQAGPERPQSERPQSERPQSEPAQSEPAQSEPATDDDFLNELRGILSDDLNTPGAIEAIDARIAAGIAPSKHLLEALNALLGVRLAAGRA